MFYCFTFNLLVLFLLKYNIHSFISRTLHLLSHTTEAWQIIFCHSVSCFAYIWVTFHSTKERWSLCTPADALREMHLRWQFSSCCVHLSLEVQERMCMAAALAAHHQLRSLDHCLIGQVEGSILAVFHYCPCATKKRWTSVSRAANPA